MQRCFLYFYILILSFVGSDIKNLQIINYYNTCVLIVFLSIVFMTLNAVQFYNRKTDCIFIGRPELFLFIFLFWSAATFFFSVIPEVTIFPAIKCLGAIAFGLGLILYLEKKEQLIQLWLVSYIFSGIHSSLLVIQGFFPLFLPENIRIESSPVLQFFTNANYFSCYLLLHIPIGVYLYFRTPKSYSKFLIGLGWITTLVALGLSDSQAALMIACIQILVSVAYFLSQKKPKRATSVTLGAIAAYLIYFYLMNLTTDTNDLSLSTIINAPGAKIITSPFNESNWVEQHIGIRLWYWLGAWKMFCEHWLLGNGLWTYNDLYPYTGLLKISGDPYNILPPHAHNLYLQTAAETGLIGILLLSFCLLLLFKNNIKILINKKRWNLDLNFFLLISAIGFLIHNISESNWLNSLFVYYFVLITLSIGYLYRKNSFEPFSFLTFRKKYFLPIYLFFVIVACFPVVSFYKYNQIIINPEISLQTQAQFEDKLNQAISLCESCWRPRYLFGLAKINRYQKTKRIELLNEAQKHLSEALARNPYSPKITMLQGNIYILQNKNKEAIHSFEMAKKHPWYRSQALKKIKSL
ncbi:MAG: hypothetical protein F3740_09045 [Nitrospinae bacterium]|nr:hypothetical protein [Nitrospinota bacterium]